MGREAKGRCWQQLEAMEMARHEPVRMPAVAGQFYSGSPTGLLREIEQCYLSPLGPGELPEVRPDGPRRLVGLVSPHAGYMYSGPTAAHGYYYMAQDGVPDVVVIIGPCHQLTALVPAAVQTTGSWATPLGHAIIDDHTATVVAEAWEEFGIGERYFAAEHSLEVQVPFLQHLYGDALRIVPVMIVDQNRRTARAVGAAVAEAIAGRNAVIVASTDLNHYVPASRAEQLDKPLIERIVALDPDGLIELARDPRMSMCGYGAVAAMLYAAIELGASRGKMLAYSHSGMVAPMPDVVGYVSAAIEK